MYVALTISPKPFEMDHKALLQIYKKNYLDRIKVPYLLYPEIDLNGRLHFHGYILRDIKLINEYHWSIKMLKNWCFICIKEIKQADKWSKYIKKDWKITKKLLKLKQPLSNDLNDTSSKGITLLDYTGFVVEKCEKSHNT